MLHDSLGPIKCLPMFGGLHIEKMFPEIHGQLNAGSRLAKFLDPDNVVITGAGNVVVNVFQITSTSYLFKCVCVLNLKQ